MDTFWKITAAILIAVILSLTLGRQDMGILLSIAVGCMAAAAVIAYLTPVLDFLRELESVGQLKHGMLDILLKAVGIALTTEVASKICKDAGNSALEKSLQMLGSAVILYLSIPIFQSLLSFAQEILGEL